MKCYYYLQMLLNVAKSITIYNTIKKKKTFKQKQRQELKWFQSVCFVTEDITQQLKKGISILGTIRNSTFGFGSYYL